MGIEKLVHTDSLPLVIETIKNLAFDEGEVKQSCRISIIKGQVDSKQMRVSVYPLREPAMTFLVLGVH